MNYEVEREEMHNAGMLNAEISIHNSTMKLRTPYKRVRSSPDSQNPHIEYQESSIEHPLCLPND